MKNVIAEIESVFKTRTELHINFITLLREYHDSLSAQYLDISIVMRDKNLSKIDYDRYKLLQKEIVERQDIVSNKIFNTQEQMKDIEQEEKDELKKHILNHAKTLTIPLAEKLKENGFVLFRFDEFRSPISEYDVNYHIIVPKGWTNKDQFALLEIFPHLNIAELSFSRYQKEALLESKKVIESVLKSKFTEQLDISQLQEFFANGDA